MRFLFNCRADRLFEPISKFPMIAEHCIRCKPENEGFRAFYLGRSEPLFILQRELVFLAIVDISDIHSIGHPLHGWFGQIAIFIQIELNIVSGY